MQLQIELQALEKETDEASVARREAIEREIADLQERSAGMKAQWQREKDAIESVKVVRERLEQARVEAERAEREADLQRAAELRYGEIPELERQLAEAEASEGAPRRRAAVPEGEGRRRGRRRGRRQVDRHPRLAPAGGRGREARAHGGAAAPARDRPARGGRGGRERAAALARRPAGPGPADRHVPVPRPDRRRQDRAGARARRVHVRLAGRDDPHRHVGVHGETRRLAARRRAARLRRLRGGRPADRGGPPPALLASCCSTRSRRPTATSSTSCCR